MKTKQTTSIDAAKQRGRLFLITALLLLAACTGGGIAPVELLPEDMCASCKMAISEKKYAAEFINQDGEAFKFDDIGCLAGYVKNKTSRASITAFFVVDFESKQWLKAEEAVFVQSSQFQTPMAGGIVAFRDKAKAEAAAASNQGRLISFAEVLGESSK
jgi:copper chaperone NosL